MRFLPLIALGGGAALLMASRGKKKGAQADHDEFDDAELAADASVPPKLSATPQTRELQEVLHALGYGAIVGAIDGKKGGKTTAGIKAFQGEYNSWADRRKSLKVDGVWGPNSSDAADHALRELRSSGLSSFSELVDGGIPDSSSAPGQPSPGSESGNVLLPPSPQRGITISTAGDQYAIYSTYRYTTLQNYLIKAKNDHRLLTNSDKQTWGKFFYDTFMKDPSTWIGEVTGAGPNGGAAIYAGLWMIATLGAAAAAAPVVGGAAAGASASGAATTTALAIPASSSTALAAAAPAVTTIIIPAGGTATVGLSGLGWGVAGAAAVASAGAQVGLAYKAGTALKNLAAGEKIPESAYKSIVDDLGKKYPRWKQYPDLAASALETLFAFVETHHAYIGDKPYKIRLSDLPPSQATIAIYEVILGNIYRFQVSN